MTWSPCLRCTRNRSVAASGTCFSSLYPPLLVTSSFPGHQFSSLYPPLLVTLARAPAAPLLATSNKVRTHWDAHAVQHLLLELVAALRAAATLDQNVGGFATGWHGAPSESAS